MSIAARRARSAAAHRNISVCVTDGYLVLRDVGRHHRLPTARTDSGTGVRTLHIVGVPYYSAAQAGAHFGQVGGPPRRALYDLLIGLDEDGRRLFEAPLGWPPEAVKDFCHSVGLRYRSPRDYASRWQLSKAHPRARGAVRLWASWPSRLISGCFVAAFLAVPVAFALLAVVLTVRAVR